MHETSMSGQVLALVNDLVFASKIRGAGTAVGVSTRTLASPEALLEACRQTSATLVLLDLETRAADVPELIARLKADDRTAALPVVAFVSHVNRAAIEAARAAGADRVLARSAFVRELPTLLRQARSGGRPDEA